MSNLQVTLTFSDIFPDETGDLTALLESLPLQELLCWAGYVNAQLFINPESVEETQIKILNELKLSDDVVGKIEDFFSRMHMQHDIPNIFNKVSTLLLIQHTLQLESCEKNKKTSISILQGDILFKTYLLCSSEWINKHNRLINTISKNDCLEYMVVSQLPYSSIHHGAYLEAEIQKSCYFYSFCETNDYFKQYLELLLISSGEKNWKEYLLKLLGLFIRDFSTTVPPITRIEDRYVEAKAILNSLSINKQIIEDSPDFKTIRDYPIYKLDDNNFLFLDFNFWIGKLYQSLQFEMSRAVKGKMEYNGKIIKDYPQFKSIYSDNFTEKAMFYEIMDYCFKTYKMKVHGDNLSVTAPPDYVIVEKSKVFIFELKDTFIKAEVKHSYNFDDIKDELREKLDSNIDGKPKGITQLMNSIYSIENGEWDRENELSLGSHVIVYPILVVTDAALNSAGINNYLNKEFTSRLSDLPTLKRVDMKKLVVIHLDDLILIQDYLRSSRVKLNHLLNIYLREMTISNAIDKNRSFHYSLKEKVKSFEWSPTRFSQMIKEFVAN